MISKRPLLELSHEAEMLYDSVDGQRTVAALERMHPGAGDRLLEWHQAEILELIPPITRPSRPHLVVIEPHMDDAALSAGGRLLHRRGQCRITILSVVNWSNFTTYLLLKRNVLNLQEITELRQKESALLARVLGAEHRCLDWSDAPIRFWPAERWSVQTVEKFSATPQAFVKLLPDRKDVALLAEQLTQTLTALAPDELWFPMGLGDHIDHRSTRNACLLMLAEGRDRFSNIPVVMYEDIPYSTTVGQVPQIRAAIASSGGRLIPDKENIEDVFEEKLRLASIYASQFKISYMEPTLRKLAESAGGGIDRFAEAYHRLEGKPGVPPETELSRDRTGLAALQNNISVLLSAVAQRDQFTVMALPSGHLGNWKSDKDSLAAAFPNARLCIYVSDDVAWQTAEIGDEWVRLKIVRKGWRGWAAVFCREVFRFGTPTVVLWRGAYCTEPMRPAKKLVNIFIKVLLPFRRVLFARTLWDFCSLLNEQLETNHRSKSEAERVPVHQ
ncbi:MAG: PIG-L family deacetylase [Candidatus Sulfotelmatobacter sp.]